MAKVVHNDDNRFRSTWQHAKGQGVSRQVVADSLGLSRGRLNDLILGRAHPTLGESAALTSGRRATLVRYVDTSGGRHSFYTGAGMSFERLMEADVLEEMADEQVADNHYHDRAAFVELRSRYPKLPQLTKVHSIRKRHADRVRDMRVNRT